MTYTKLIASIYCKILGKTIKNKLKEANILQNQIGYTDTDEETVLLSETSVCQILNGNRNMTYNATLAFQETLNYRTPKILFYTRRFF